MEKSPNSGTATAASLITLPDEILIKIVQYGTINDIVLKERISQRFKSIVDLVIKSQTVIRGLDYHADMDNVMAVVSRMPNARTIVRSKGYNYDLSSCQVVMTKLANCKNNLVKFVDYSDQSILKYISTIKSIDCNFTGKEIDHCFEVSWFNGRKVLELLAKYPDLQLDLGIDGYEVDQFFDRSVITKLTLSDPRDALKPIKLTNGGGNNLVNQCSQFINCKEVNYNSLVDLNWNSFNFLPNLTIVTLEVQYQELFKPLEIIHSKYNNLTTLRLTNYVYKFEEKDFIVLEKIISKKSLINLTIYSGIEVNKLISDRVINMIIKNSLMMKKKWKQLHLPGIDVSGNVMSIRKDDDFTNYDSLINLYSLFKRVNLITFNQEDEYIEQLNGLVQRMAQSDKRRSVKLIVNQGLCNEHTYLF